MNNNILSLLAETRLELSSLLSYKSQTALIVM